MLLRGVEDRMACPSPATAAARVHVGPRLPLVKYVLGLKRRRPDA
jgi:hypothetical protein